MSRILALLILGFCLPASGFARPGPEFARLIHAGAAPPILGAVPAETVTLLNRFYARPEIFRRSINPVLERLAWARQESDQLVILATVLARHSPWLYDPSAWDKPEQVFAAMDEAVDLAAVLADNHRLKIFSECQALRREINAWSDKERAGKPLDRSRLQQLLHDLAAKSDALARLAAVSESYLPSWDTAFALNMLSNVRSRQTAKDILARMGAARRGRIAAVEASAAAAPQTGRHSAAPVLGSVGRAIKSQLQAEQKMGSLLDARSGEEFEGVLASIIEDIRTSADKRLQYELAENLILAARQFPEMERSLRVFDALDAVSEHLSEPRSREDALSLLLVDITAPRELHEQGPVHHLDEPAYARRALRTYVLITLQSPFKIVEQALGNLEANREALFRQDKQAAAEALAGLRAAADPDRAQRRNIPSLRNSASDAATLNWIVVMLMMHTAVIYYWHNTYQMIGNSWNPLYFLPVALWILQEIKNSWTRVSWKEEDRPYRIEDALKSVRKNAGKWPLYFFLSLATALFSSGALSLAASGLALGLAFWGYGLWQDRAFLEKRVEEIRRERKP
ncbi:MAG: hypothetical protein HY921_09940 [Elusimicrobia bacterium]|nr:hypothetical protein [Elusimicrobiota bacterium]